MNYFWEPQEYMSLEENFLNVYKLFYLITIEHVHNLKFRKYRKNEEDNSKDFFSSLQGNACSIS